MLFTGQKNFFRAIKNLLLFKQKFKDMSTAPSKILGLLVTSIIFMNVNASAQCASNSNTFSFTYNNHTYKIIKEQKNWSNAANCSVTFGGYLAEIDSQSEQDTIYNRIQNLANVSPNYTSVQDGGGIAYVWIGATDQQTEGTWLWDGDNTNSGTNFWTGQGTAGNGGGSAVGGNYNNWGGSSSGSPNEPDDFNGQDAAGIGLSGWPSFNPGSLGNAGEWNDIDVSNQLYYVVEQNCIATETTDTVTACDSFTWTNGITYTSDNNTATDTLNTVNGCDSVVNLNLTIKNSTATTDSIQTCDSLTWIDSNTYTSDTSVTYTLNNSVNCDSVVTLELDIQNSSTVDSVTACDSFTWIDGNTYTSDTNSATFTLNNDAGCDSTITLNLDINKSTSSIDSVEACNSFTWIDSNTYKTDTNSATVTLTNEAGCDSVLTLNLSIQDSVTTTDQITACDSFTWIDSNTYTSDTSVTYTLNNSVNCDSVVTLELDIQNSSTVDSVTACDSFTWIDGNTYTSDTNSATFTLNNDAGCDSTITLNLDINKSTSSIDSVEACNSFTWIDSNTYKTDTNSATVTLTNEAGCDSVLTLNLSIQDSVTTTDQITACDSFTWIDGNTYKTDNDTAMAVFNKANGCDSVVLLDLTIQNSISTTDSIIACDSFTWTNGVTYTRDTSGVTQQFQTSNGCDSIVSLHLEINNSSSTTDSVKACGSAFTWIDGTTYTSDTDTPTFALNNTNGCDSLITLNLNLVKIDTSVSKSGSTLESNASNADYQWLNCENNDYTVIQGATGQSFNPDQSGNYAVQITKEGCLDTSSCRQVSTAGLNSKQTGGTNVVSVYPNPFEDVVQVRLAKTYEEVQVSIRAVSGKVLQKATHSNAKTLNMALDQPKGLYFMTILTPDNQTVIKLMKR